jgi:hypothetical protein
VVQLLDDSDGNENPETRDELCRNVAAEMIRKTSPIMRAKLRRTGVDVMSDSGRAARHVLVSKLNHRLLIADPTLPRKSGWQVRQAVNSSRSAMICRRFANAAGECQKGWVSPQPIHRDSGSHGSSWRGRLPAALQQHEFTLVVRTSQLRNGVGNARPNMTTVVNHCRHPPHSGFSHGIQNALNFAESNRGAASRRDYGSERSNQMMSRPS